MKSVAVVLFLAVAVAAAENAIDWSKVEHMEMNPMWRNLPVLPTPEGKITGGQEAKPKQFPYQVALFVHTEDGKTAFCGGSLISTQYVLTAAHCADIAKSFTVVLGAHNVTDDKEPGQVRLESSTKVVHPKWNQLLIRNDVALVKLPQKVTLNDRIQLVRLPKKSQESTSFANLEGTASGWGKDSDSATGVSPVLRFVKNKVITNDECNQIFFGVIQPTNVCLSGEGGRSTCSGDSGGPLTVVDTDSKITQVGLTSFGLAFGCELGFPTGFTRVTGYLDWIEQNSDVKVEK